VEGGAEFILLETVFDTLNCKAAIKGVKDLEADLGREVPLMISLTLTDLSGRNLSGHTVEAFWHAVRHANPVAIGLNCSFGAEQLRPHVQLLSDLADTLLMAYPNAGLPNELGEYDEEPETTARLVSEWAQGGKVNVLGGCCGSTPDHIAAIARVVEGVKPRELPNLDPKMRLAGLEPFTIAA
jgi:5-methyltetrahydrofolate--homocysteine methyltransferase